MSMCVCAMCIPLWQLFKIVEQIKSNKQRSSCRKNNPFILHLKLHSLDVKATPSRYCCFRRGVDLSEWCLYHGRWDYYIDIYIYILYRWERLYHAMTQCQNTLHSLLLIYILMIGVASFIKFKICILPN